MFISKWYYSRIRIFDKYSVHDFFLNMISYGCQYFKELIPETKTIKSLYKLAKNRPYLVDLLVTMHIHMYIYALMHYMRIYINAKQANMEKHT